MLIKDTKHNIIITTPFWMYNYKRYTYKYYK